MIERKRITLFALYCTFFIDMLGATIIFPLFAPLFLDVHFSLFPTTTSFAFRSSMLGIFLGIYPLAQFFCAPLMGQLADKYGRKKILLLTVFLTFIGYMCCGFSIHGRWIIPLFFSRIVMGAAAGNVSLCLASLSDLSTNSKERAHYLSVGSLIAGAAFILGPFLGGKLSDHTLSTLFNLAFPLWVGAFLAVSNFIFVSLGLSETLKKKEKVRVDFTKGWKSLSHIKDFSGLKKLFVLYFFYLFALNILIQFLPAFLVRNFQSNSSQIGDISALMGLFWVLGSIIFNRLLIERFSHKKILLISAFSFCACMILSFIFNYRMELFIFLSLAIVAASFCWPLALNAISSSQPSHMQGKLQGLTQSVQSLAMIAAPVFIGPILPTHAGSIFISSALFGAVFALMALFSKDYHGIAK